MSNKKKFGFDGSTEKQHHLVSNAQHILYMMQLSSPFFRPPNRIQMSTNIWIRNFWRGQCRALLVSPNDKRTYYWNIIQETNLHVCFSFLRSFLPVRDFYHQTYKLWHGKCSHICVFFSLHIFMHLVGTSRTGNPCKGCTNHAWQWNRSFQFKKKSIRVDSVGDFTDLWP